MYDIYRNVAFLCNFNTEIYQNITSDKNFNLFVSKAFSDYIIWHLVFSGLYCERTIMRGLVNEYLKKFINKHSFIQNLFKIHLLT